ncbi:MAG: amino acid permease [Solirubrobacteraceae bacterium]
MKRQRRGMPAMPKWELETPPALKRGVGAPALFGIVQGFIAASIYFGLGLVVQAAAGYTWIVYLVSALFFGFVVLSYVEGASLHQERGGATIIARYAFNELWSFIAGWAILLDYILLIALTAFATTDYVAVLFPPLAGGAAEFLFGAAVVAGVAWLNIRGAGSKRYERFSFVVLGDLVLQTTIVILGLALLLNPDVLTHPASIAGTPSTSNLVFAFTLTLVTFAGVDASSGLAGEVKVSRRGLKRLVTARLLAFIPYVGISLVAVSVLPVRTGLRSGADNYVDAPMLGVAAGFHQAWLSDALRLLIGLSAFAILVIACNAAMLGLSRLGYSLALNRQIPSAVGRLHPTRATPVVIICIGALLAVLLLIPADLEFLASIYAFGATISFTIVHASVIRLRWREPDRDRPFKAPLNLRIGRGELPVTAALGGMMSAAAFVAVVLLHDSARWAGIGWMALGIALYVGYRRVEGKPILKRVTIPERALTRRGRTKAEYGSILVPVLGTPLDDDIMQTAGRLSMEENADEGEGGAVIEAVWVFEVPMALPLDARIGEDDLKRARKALQRAKAVGEEYQGVEVATATVRARRAGEGIVREARRRGVEAIVLAAEEPTRMRGGPLLGGKRGLYDTFVGQTTRYVVTKAHCRVILTAPPGEGHQRPRPPSRLLRIAQPHAVDPTKLPGLTSEDGRDGISDPDAAAKTPGG